MNQLKAIYDITKQLDTILSQTITPKNREHVVEQVSSLIEQRGALMDEIKGESSFNDEEKLLGREIIAFNHRIEKEMNILFDELKLEMKSIRKQKKSNQNYVNPYENVQLMDGMFLDSKQ